MNSQHKKVAIRNIVAKYAHKFNKAAVIPDKNKLYSRKDKHKKNLKDFS